MTNLTQLHRCSPDPGYALQPKTSSDVELDRVLGAIARLMDAQGAILTSCAEPEESTQAGSICLAHTLDVDPAAIIAGLDLHARGSDDISWSTVDRDTGPLDVMTMPVAAVEGHNRVAVSVLFGGPDRPHRRRAEQTIKFREPIAAGYFRLWQLERVRARRLAAMEAACDVSDLGILLFTRGGELDFVNTAAAELLAKGDGLRRHRQSVQASEIADSVKIQVAINHAIAVNDAGDGTPSTRRRAPLIRLRRASGEPLIVAVVAAERRAVEPGDIAVMVYLFDPMLDLDRLLKPVCSAFKLSPVETRLASQLAAGRAIADVASTLRIKVQTARGYLKQIFIKTDTRRQAELVHLMLSNVMRVGWTIMPEIL